jgi:tetratricopeptide (TPR) repeat protein
MRFVTSIVCVFVAAAAASARAQDLSKLTPPLNWIEPLLPEDLPPLKYPAYANDLDKAKFESFSGRYKKSLLTLYKWKDADAVEVALVKGASLAALGRREEAIELLAKAPVADDARAQILRIRILSELGRSEEALEGLKAHLEKHPDSIAGHFWLGALHEQTGDLTKALEAYAWFVSPPQDFLKRLTTQREKAFENAEDVTLIGRAIDRWAAMTGSYQKLPDLHDTLLNIFVRAYDVIDRAYWPAHVASAEYFLSHDNATQAKGELKASLSANPNDLASWKLVAQIALDEYNFDGADKAIESIRKVDRDSIDADELEARNLLKQRRPADAARAIDRVLAKQPKNLEALGLSAAAYALQLKDDKMREALKHVEEIDPDNATAYFEVAEQLAALRQYPRSAAMYKIAVDRTPWWTAPRNGLGLLYTQSGDEDEAQVVLNAAHELDPFNLQTTNYLRLLEDLNRFAKKESAHFVVFYDASIDPLIPEYFASISKASTRTSCRDSSTSRR